MAPVYKLPASPFYNPEQALNSAINEDLDHVLIAGYKENGELFIRSSSMTCAEALFLSMKVARWAESGGES